MPSTDDAKAGAPPLAGAICSYFVLDKNPITAHIRFVLFGEGRFMRRR
jgi:hypothetical protein